MPQHALDDAALPTFAELGVPTPLVEKLAADGITTPFAIQAATLPDALAGRDVLGRGRTGSGKTLAFALAMLNTLLNSDIRRTPNAPRALVLVPTRELAQQVADVVEPLARSLHMRTATIYGGVSYNPQRSALRRGVDVVIATPGRLEDLMSTDTIVMDAIEVTVLDEADHMADLGFLPGVKRILDATPSDAQRLLFSATLDGGIGELVKRYLTNPVSHEVDPGDADVPVMAHHVFMVDGREKAEVVRQLVEGEGRTVAFTRTKHGARNLAQRLTDAGIPAVDLHGNLSQAVRQKNLTRFSSGRVRVLVATDIAARGIHVDDVTLVVHVDPPAEHKAYVHRSGRTARAGNEGVVVTVATSQQRGSVKSLMKLAGISPVMRPVAPGDRAIGELVGAPADRVHGATLEPTADEQRAARAARPRENRPHGRGASAHGRTHSGDRRPSSRSGENSTRPRPAREASNERPARSERPADRTTQGERPARSDRAPRKEYGDRPVRNDRAPRKEYGDRPAARGDRPVHSDRADRPVRNDRSSRPARSDRFDGSSRPERGPRTERTERPARAAQPERHASADREMRPTKKPRHGQVERRARAVGESNDRGRTGQSTRTEKPAHADETASSRPRRAKPVSQRSESKRATTKRASAQRKAAAAGHDGRVRTRSAAKAPAGSKSSRPSTSRRTD